MAILGVEIIIILALVALYLHFWRQSSRFEKFFGFMPEFFNINISQRPKVERIIFKKWQELMARPWEPDKNNPIKNFEDFSETQALLKNYRQMVIIAGLFGYREENEFAGLFECQEENGNSQLSFLEEKIKKLRREIEIF